MINNRDSISLCRKTCRRLSKVIKTKMIHKKRQKIIINKQNKEEQIEQAQSNKNSSEIKQPSQEFFNSIENQPNQLGLDIEQEQLNRKQEKTLKQKDNEDQELIPLGAEIQENWYFSGKKFEETQLSQKTLKALKQNNYHVMTHIQSRTLPYLLKGRDVLGAAKTGSGKTLAYIIPCFELLNRFQFTQKNGTGVIVILPTRELAIQVFQVAKKIAKHHNKTIGLLIGGMNRKAESIKLQKGVNLLICTPGRLLDHLQNSKFVYHNLLSLVIDQADAILKIGFEEQLTQILRSLPKQRQTILFSATQTRKVDDLAKLSLKDPIYIGVDDTDPTATVQNLEQGFVVIPAQRKFQLLFTFLQKQKSKKVMIFFSSCNQVKFYSDLLNYVDIPVMQIHGKQKQQKRSTTFYEFSEQTHGILLCTDVAARGLDIPAVDWIIQYDPPLDIKQYIHRVGRTCRGHESRGRALIFLLPQEKGYLKHLLQAKVSLNQYEIEDNQLSNIQQEFMLLIQKNHYLATESCSAYKSYLHAYTTYGLKQVFNVHSLDLKKIALSFGLKRPPHVELNVKIGGKNVKKFGQKRNFSNY